MRCVLAILGLLCWRATGFRAAPPPRARVRRASSADTLDSAAADAVPPTPSPGLPAGRPGDGVGGTASAAAESSVSALDARRTRARGGGAARKPVARQQSSPSIASTQRMTHS